MSHIPRISVVMPAYNAEKYIGEAIESILQQTFSDFEYIIIDDGSTDRTWEIIQEYAQKDERVVVMQNEKNMGVSVTANSAMSMAKGEYIARMDADDISMPERFEKQVAFLDANPDIGIVGSTVNIVNVFGKISRQKKYCLSDALIKKRMYYTTPICQGVLMVRNELIKKYGGYDIGFLLAEDDELYYRLSQYTQFANLPDVLLCVRMNNMSITKRNVFQLEKYTRKAKKMLVENYGYKTTMINKILAYVILKTYILTRLLNIYR